MANVGYFMINILGVFLFDTRVCSFAFAFGICSPLAFSICFYNCITSINMFGKKETVKWPLDRRLGLCILLLVTQPFWSSALLLLPRFQLRLVLFVSYKCAYYIIIIFVIFVVLFIFCNRITVYISFSLWPCWSILRAIFYNILCALE